jgi:hypothetical protein
LAVIAQDKSHALIRDDDKEVEIAEQKKKDLMAALMLQLNEKEAYKYLEKERLECERGKMRQVWEDWDMEELRKAALLREKKHSFGIELLEDQMLHLEFQKEAKALDRREDEKVTLDTRHSISLAIGTVYLKPCVPGCDTCLPFFGR